MVEEKKYPRAVVGVFIFNEQGELFLMRATNFHNKYTCPGGGVELGESVEEACHREVKEETNMDIDHLEFLGVSDGLNLDEIYTKKENHLIFINYKARAVNTNNIKLNEEGIKYKWLPVSEWLANKDVSPTTLGPIKDYLAGGNDFENKYKRALADYQNLLKQSAREKQEFVKYANEQIILEILSVYDNLKIAFAHADEATAANGWLEGIKHIIKQFKEVLENGGVKEIKSLGEKFDSTKMEAVENKETEEEKMDDMVAKELKAGYELNGKIISPARVAVYKYKK